MTLYIDHEPLNEIQVPKMCRIMDQKVQANNIQTTDIVKTVWTGEDKKGFITLVNDIIKYLEQVEQDIEQDLDEAEDLRKKAKTKQNL